MLERLNGIMNHPDTVYPGTEKNTMILYLGLANLTWFEDKRLSWFGFSLFLAVSFQFREGSDKRSEEQQEQMDFLKRVPEGSLAVLRLQPPPTAQCGSSRTDPGIVTDCAFLSTPWCRLQVWCGKCAVTITGARAAAQGGVYCQGSLGNKKRKALSKHFLPAGAICFH